MEREKDGITKWFILIVVTLGTFMAMLDSSIVNIAIPKMMSVFGSDINKTKWVITGYTLTLGAVIPLTGYLCEVFGSKKTFVFALIIFTLGSFLCGFSTTITQMIIFRVIQALGGGMIMPVGMGMLMQTFDVKERGTALGFWGIAAMAAPSVGPTFGGYIIQYLDWRLIFYINIPIGVFTVILALILLPHTEGKKETRFDLIGFITSTVGLVFVLYVLGLGSNLSWKHMWNPLLLVIGIFCLILFVINELSIDNPLLDLKLFKIKSFAISQVVLTALTIVSMGGIYILPLFLQSMKGYSAMQSGLIIMPSAIVMGFMMPISGKIFDKFGYKAVVLPGLIILAYASYKLAIVINLDTSKATIIKYSVLRSLGLGLSMMPINTIGMVDVPRHLSTKATAISSVIRQIAAAISITYLTTTISKNANLNYAEVARKATAFNQPFDALLKNLQNLYSSAGLPPNVAHGQAVGTLTGFLYKQAYTLSMSKATGYLAVMAIATIFIAMLVNDKKKVQCDIK